MKNLADSQIFFSFTEEITKLMQHGSLTFETQFKQNIHLLKGRQELS